MRLIRLCFIAAAATAAAAEQPTLRATPAEPVVHRGYYPALNATDPPVAKCSEGLLNVIIEALGLDQTLKPQANSEELASAQLRMHMETHIPALVSTFDIVMANLLDSVNTTQDGRLQLTDMTKDGTSALYTGLAAAGVGSVQGLLPLEIQKALAPLILYLISPTWNVFLGDMLGKATGPFSESSLLIMNFPNTPLEGFRTRNNLLGSYAKAIDYAMNYDVDTTRRLCSMQNAIVALFACGMPDSPFDKSICAKSFESPYAKTCSYKDSNGEEQSFAIDDSYVANPFFEVDLRDKTGELPMNLESITPEERVKLYFLWFAIMGCSYYTSTTFACGRLNPDYDLLPGWTLTDVISYDQPGSELQLQKVRPDIPFSLIFKPKKPDDSNKCSIVILIRGTSNAYEWGIDTELAAIPGPSVPGSNIHGGFAKVVASNYPHIQEVLAESSNTCKSLKVMVAGHSLGAASAHILGYWLALHYPQHDIQVASFAAPNVFEAPDLAVFRKIVNARRLWVSTDPVSRAPLSTDQTKYGFPGCHFINKIRTGSPGLFAPHPAAYKIEIADLYDGIQTSPFHDDWLGFKLSFRTAMPKVFPEEWKVDVAGGKVPFVLFESSDKVKKLIEGFKDNNKEIKPLLDELKGTKIKTGVIDPKDTVARNVCIALKVGIPLSINVSLSHIDAYQCWAALGCQSSGQVKDCGMTAPIAIAICIA